MKTLVGILAIGFIPAMIIAWVFEITPDGLKRDADIEASESNNARSIQTAQKMNRLIIVGLLLTLAYFSADKDNEYFSDGVAEEILNSLAKLKDLKVAGRTSSFSFKGKNDDLRSIGEKPGPCLLLRCTCFDSINPNWACRC